MILDIYNYIQNINSDSLFKVSLILSLSVFGIIVLIGFLIGHIPESLIIGVFTGICVYLILFYYLIRFVSMQNALKNGPIIISNGSAIY